MTNPIDTSPEAIAALLDGVTPGPWVAESGHTQQNGQMYWQVSDEYDAIVQNQFCWARGDHAANARFIAAARDLVPVMAAEIARLTTVLSIWIDRAERAEAERDEAREQALVFQAIASVNSKVMLRLEGDSKTVTLEALLDATAALARRDAAMRNEGRRQAAAACDWGDIYGDNAVSVILATLEPEGGE